MALTSALKKSENLSNETVSLHPFGLRGKDRLEKQFEGLRQKTGAYKACSGSKGHMIRSCKRLEKAVANAIKPVMGGMTTAGCRRPEGSQPAKKRLKMAFEDASDIMRKLVALPPKRLINLLNCIDGKGAKAQRRTARINFNRSAVHLPSSRRAYSVCAIRV